MIQGAGAPTGNAPVARLERGATATRDCGAGSTSPMINIGPYDPASLRLDIVAKFKWPFIPIEDEERRHFTVRPADGGRAILVPDVEG